MFASQSNATPTRLRQVRVLEIVAERIVVTQGPDALLLTDGVVLLIASLTPTSTHCGPARTTTTCTDPVSQTLSRGETSQTGSDTGRSSGNWADPDGLSLSERQGREGWWAAACSKSVLTTARSPSCRTGSSRRIGVEGTQLARLNWCAGTRSIAWVLCAWSCTSSQRMTPLYAWRPKQASCKKASFVNTIAATVDGGTWCSSRAFARLACSRDHRVLRMR
jgi:hypothetical protein